MDRRYHTRVIPFPDGGLFEAEELVNVKGCYNGSIYIRPDRLSIPAQTKKPTVFSVWNDLFHEDVPLRFIESAFTIMHKCPQHTFLILTKRSKRMAETIFSGNDNIWFGVSVESEDQMHRVDDLLRIPGKRFISFEPLLGGIDCRFDAGHESGGIQGWIPGINPDGIIVGAETGPQKRECKPEWINNIVRQGKEAGIPVWVKASPSGTEIVREKGW